ncbi:hypothetical protein SAMN04487944_12811 [Gracilibacillus ureilyticus]|uniref:Uncharacterized protein n=1 Tax=Gracilibacillus ureilyticus TaxID=531814 RepID=A0A1H9VUY4_9BACI|nr:hypothetical protein [Gracilibacillus ureilyticus]SES25349.1 hypothetical protein SAMN04487944_12811 [Gracilibacillus ureilyticus]
MIILVILIPVVSIMIGLYLITQGLWELRIGENQTRYAKLMFTGLFLVIILPVLIFLFGNLLNMQIG